MRFVLILFLGVSSASLAAWQPHEVRLLDGDKEVRVPAQLQIVTEAWNRVVAVPYIAYLPEKDRVLMLVSCDYPHQAMVLWSDDHGATWTPPKFVHTDAEGKPDTGMGTSLTYLGDGKTILSASGLWFSSDFGQTWSDPVPVPPTPDGKTWNLWDPLFADRDRATGKLVRLFETGYGMDNDWYTAAKGPGYSTGYLRSSTDGGHTWGEAVQPPSWHGVSEVTLTRAKNGDLVAACRTDIPARFKETLDHFEGLSTSVSKDDGKTWSPLNRIYDWGRHHPSLVVTPKGDIVMTYVVRKGYVETAEKMPQFGVEAVVSTDNGQTWDLDHRYILHAWVGNRTGENYWWASSQATSTVVLPDGNLLTVFGTGYRSQPNDKNMPTPRDAGLVLWRLNDTPLSPVRTITDAPADSELRNLVDPAPKAVKTRE